MTAIADLVRARTEHDIWRGQRAAYVTGETGPLALVLTRWGRPGAEPVTDEEARVGQAEDAILTRVQRSSIDGEGIEHGFRIWNTSSPATQAFERIACYDYDAGLVLDATFERVDEPRLVPVEHISDGGRTRQTPLSGDLVFQREGVEYRLWAFDLGEHLHVIFADTTTGTESYAPGRFLFVPRPADIAAGDRVRVTLDLNRAFIPPCGFSTQMNCPLPPAQNRLGFAVRGGERTVLYRDGFTLG